MSVIRVVNKFSKILSHHQKLRIIELSILMVLSGFLEMASVSLMIPFMEAVNSPEKLMANNYVTTVCAMLGIQNYRTFLALLALFMAILYIAKNCFLLFQMLVQNKFVYNNRFYTQRMLLRSYLSKPYEFFLGIKSGDVLQVINNDTTIVFNLLGMLLSFFSEMVVSVSLVIAILIMSPGITVGIAVLMLIMVCLIHTGIRPILKHAGEVSRAANASTQQWVLQAIQAVKEVKIMRLEGFFEKKYEQFGKEYSRFTYISNTLGLVPRFMIEAFSMASFFLVIAFMIYRGMELESLIPILSGVAMAAIRLLPSVNRITSSLAAIANSEAALDSMKDRLSDIVNLQEDIGGKGQGGLQPKGLISGLKTSIVMEDVDYRYPKGKANVLDHAAITIKKGQAVGIVGPSGAGKTTVVDILLGLLEPSNGLIKIDNIPIFDDMGGWLSNIGYIPQQIFMLDGNIRTNVALGINEEEVDDDRVWGALKEASIDGFVKSLAEGLNTQIGERGLRLSGGQRQRIGIARALYTNPEVLFLDEATSALDNETERAIMDSINHLHGTKTLIIIAHRMSTIENCDIVYRVESGNITVT